MRRLSEGLLIKCEEKSCWEIEGSLGSACWALGAYIVVKFLRLQCDICLYHASEREKLERENSGFSKARSVIGALYVSTLENKNTLIVSELVGR
jgi:hypothetical protein